MFRISEALILRPILFKTFLAKSFLFLAIMILQVLKMTIRLIFILQKRDDAIESLEQTSSSLFKFFEHNLLKGNTDKGHFLVSTDQEA